MHPYPGLVFFDQFFNAEIISDNAGTLLEFFWVNVKLSALSEAIVLVTALLFAVLRLAPGRTGRPLRALAIGYLDFFRGVPLILILFAVAFGLPQLGFPFDHLSLFWLSVLAIVLTYTAYVAEVYRAGIESVHYGQIEAARSLGMTHTQTLRHVVIPQAVRRVIPPLLNDFIALTKDSALASVIGLTEVLRAASDLEGNTFNSSGFTVAAVYFVIVTIPLARLTDRLIAREQRRLRRAAVA